MQIAILCVSTLSLAASVGTLLIMAKTAHELKDAKEGLEVKVAHVEGKVTRNAKVVKDALGKLEF